MSSPDVESPPSCHDITQAMNVPFNLSYPTQHMAYPGLLLTNGCLPLYPFPVLWLLKQKVTGQQQEINNLYQSRQRGDGELSVMKTELAALRQRQGNTSRELKVWTNFCWHPACLKRRRTRSSTAATHAGKERPPLGP